MAHLNFEIVFDRICERVKAYQDVELAQFLGVSPQAVFSAKKKKQIPKTWFKTIQEKIGVTREELCGTPYINKPTMPANSGNIVNAQDCYQVRVNQQQGGGLPSEPILDITERERRLIEAMRLYASEAMWAKIESDLAKESEKYR